MSLGSETDFLFHERVAERDEGRGLIAASAAAMTTGGRLVEIGLVAQGPQLGRHLPGMARMDAVVVARGGEQDRRIATARLCQMIGRVCLQERPIPRFLRVAVFRDPTGACE